MEKPRKCRNIFGIMVCKLKNGVITAFPADKKVDVNVFTKEGCNECKSVVKSVKKLVKPVKDIANVNVIYINDETKLEYPNISSVPFVQVGDKRLKNPIDYSEIWTGIFNSMGISKQATNDWEWV